MEPTFIGISDPLWFLIIQSAGTFLGIVIIALVTWMVAVRKIKADLGLKQKELQFFKDKIFIEKKVDMLNDIERLQKQIATHFGEEDGSGLFLNMVAVRERLTSYVIDDDSTLIAHRGVLAVVELNKIADRIRELKESDKPIHKSVLEDFSNEARGPTATLRVVLEIIHSRLAYDLGFRPNKPPHTEEDIEILAEALLNEISDESE